MKRNEIISIIEATDACNNLSKNAIMTHRNGVTKSQMDALVSLKFAGKMSMTKLAEHLAVSKEQASRAVAPLVERGLVQRARSAEHYRVVEVSLTDDGIRWLDDDLDYVLAKVNERLEPLPERDHERLAQAAATIVEILGKVR